MPISMYDGAGRCLHFGRKLGEGGEAYVCEVSGNPATVAKIYTKVLSASKVEKLRLLPSLATPNIFSIASWPIGILSHKAGGPAVGILLPRVYGREIHFVYSPGQRRQYYPKSDWSWLVHIAMNAAAAVQTTHENSYVIGDVNQGGFFVSDEGTVRLIDCDSFQVRHSGKIYRCEVRTPLFSPPEIQSTNLNLLDATVQHDSFGLGILIFHLLFMGRHPFAGRYLGAGDMPIERAISEHRFAFSEARSSFQMEVPPNAPSLRLVHRSLADLFERAFRGDPKKRPTAADWYQELRTLKSSLRRCSAEQSHMFSSHLQDCPWCALEHAGCPPFFSSSVVSFKFDARFDLDAFWRILENLPSVPDDILNGIRPPAVQPRELPAEAKYRLLGTMEVPPAIPILDLLTMPALPQFHPPPNLGDRDSGYVAEEEPRTPEYVPATLPVERVLNLMPTPEKPSPEKIDHFAEPLKLVKKARQYWEYRTAKWTSIFASIDAVLVHQMGMPLVAGGIAILGGLGFGSVWLILWSRTQGKFRANMKIARLMQGKEDARILKVEREFSVRKSCVDDINHQRQIEFAQWVAEYEQLHVDLPRTNTDRHRVWKARCLEIGKVQEAVRARNRMRLQEWSERMRQIEIQGRKQWEIQVSEVRRQQEAIGVENRRRRQSWEALLPQHNAVVRAVTDLNDQRKKARERYDAELKQRQQTIAVAEHQFQEVQHKWKFECSRHNHDLEKIIVQLEKDRQRYLALKTLFEEELKQLNSGAFDAQRNEFLVHQLLANASIPGIGQKRKDTLSGFGIESAYDISDRGLSLVYGQGFGEKLITSLFEWRGTCEGRFKFDPRKQVASPALSKLHNRCQTERVSLQNSLRAGLEKAKKSFSLKMHAGEYAFSQATNAVGILAQARADLQIAEQY